MRGVDAKLEERPGIDQEMNSFARRQPAFGVLAFDGLGAAALANLLFFIADLGNHIGQETHVGFKTSRGRIDP